MKRLILTLAAALTLGGLAAAPAAAQPGQRTVVRTTTTTNAAPVRERTVVRTSRTVVRHRTMRWHRDWNNGRHNGWRNNRHRVCRTVWRHHQRIRTCRSW